MVKVRDTAPASGHGSGTTIRRPAPATASPSPAITRSEAPGRPRPANCAGKLRLNRPPQGRILEPRFFSRRPNKTPPLLAGGKENLPCLQISRADPCAASRSYRLYWPASSRHPNDADAYCLRGWCYVYAGEGEEAIACTDRAMRLSPFDLEACLYAQFVAHYLARRYAEALAALARLPDPSVGNEVFRAACYAQLGRDDDARQAMETFMSEGPEEFTDWPGEDPEAWRRHWIQQYPFRDPDLEHLLDGFRRAGMPV